MSKLSLDALAEFRDLWVHTPSCVFAASIEELRAWDEQLYEAIQSGELDPRPSWEIQEAEAAARVAELVIERMNTDEIASLVIAKLAPAARVIFLTETNAEPSTGQSFDWWASAARQLGVPIANPTGRKRVIDVEALRVALAKSAPASIDEPRESPTDTVRRMLAERLNGGSRAAKG
jgi:hypothetical protein